MASTAAKVQGWGRAKWKRGLGLAALPAGTNIDGGTGDTIGLTVEIFVNSAWTDISPYVYYRNGVGVTITRGRADETSQIQPQTAAMVLNNRDGRFSPRNPTGPWYGQLGRNTPLRVSRLNNGIRRYRFYGEVPTWPTTSDISGNDVTVTIQAAGMLRRIRQGTQPLRSPMFRAYTIAAVSTQFPEFAPVPPVAYWSCEDAQNSTQIASGLSGALPMAVTGTPTFAQNSDFPGSASLPVLAGSTWTGAIPVASGTTANCLNFLLSIPSAGEIDGTVVMRLLTTGTVARMDLVYNAASVGTLTVFGYDSFGTQIFTGVGATGVSGSALVMQMMLTPDATPGIVDWQLEGQSVNPDAVPFVIVFASGTVSGKLGNGTVVTVNANSKGTASAIGQIAYQAENNQGLPTTPANAYSGDSPIIRFSRLCGEQNIPATTQFVTGGIDPADETSMGYQTTDTFPTLLQQCPDTMFTPMWESRDQLALVMRSKGTMYNQAAKLTLDMSQHHLSGPLVPVDDDTYTRNDITVTRSGGSSYQAVQTTGSMSTQPPPNGVGDYATNYSLSLSSDSLLPDQAGWRLRFGTLDEPRYPQIPINLRYPAFTSNVDLLNAALTIDIGDRLDITNPPGPEYPPDTISQIVQGYTEVMGVFEHSIVFNCSPQSTWRVGYTDDTVYGHADTDGSTLAQTYPLGTETTIQVTTTNSTSPAWTTNAADFPFDIAVAGERMTVTSIAPLALGVDGTFETGVTGWTVSNGTFAQSSAQAHSGTHSGLLTASAAGTVSITTAQFAVSPNATYPLSSWMLLSSGSPDSYYGQIQWYTSGGSLISTSSIPVTLTPKSSWRNSVSDMVAPATAAFAAVVLRFTAAAGADAIYIDDLTLPQILGGTQTFTVTRSVNTVVKTQTSGTDVRLWQPMYTSV